jgi:formamidopyrimidine-DNA glycosylase
MPELPEVETCRRALESMLIGSVAGAYSHSAKRLRRQAEPEAMEALRGRRLERIERRGKYLLFLFGDEALLAHLGMSGQLFVSPLGAEPKAHEHWRLVLSDKLLRYRDPRRFGMLLRCSTAALDQHPLLAHLGPDPVADGGWRPDDLIAACSHTKRPIKHLLMDHRVVVGVGNIYATEALFVAGIDPRRSAARIAPKRLLKLHQAVQNILAKALDAGGTTLRDFRSADGAPGYFAQHLAVYGRAGLSCHDCATLIRRQTTAGRATAWCPNCQR